jgi:hypothetical protein
VPIASQTRIKKKLIKKTYEVCGGKSGFGPGFLRVLRFPLQIIPPIYSSS